MRGQPCDVAAGEGDAALAGARIAENRHHQGRLAGAVGADERYDLALADVDVDAPEGGDMAVISLYSAHAEERRVHGGVPVMDARALRPRRNKRRALRLIASRRFRPAPRLCPIARSLSARRRAGWGPRACRSGASPPWRRLPLSRAA